MRAERIPGHPLGKRLDALPQERGDHPGFPRWKWTPHTMGHRLAIWHQPQRADTLEAIDLNITAPRIYSTLKWDSRAALRSRESTGDSHEPPNRAKETEQ
jgi:hypothetical protein